MQNRITVYTMAICCLLFVLIVKAGAQQTSVQTIENSEGNEKSGSAMATFYYSSSTLPDKSDKMSYSVAFNTATKSPHSTVYKFNNTLESNITVGKDRIIHRVITDRKAGLYFGYDVVITPISATNKFKVSFKSLSVKPTSTGCLNNLAAHTLPKYPEELIIDDGDTIALDILEKPQTKLKVVDQIKITSKPVSATTVTVSSPRKRAVTNRARDFSPEAFKLKLANIEFFVNDTQIKEVGSGKSGSVSGKILYVYVPEKGRFIFSLSPQPGYNFRKVGTIEENKISFTSKGETYKLISNSPILAVSGKWNLWVLHDSDYKPNFKFPTGYVYGSAEQVQNLFREK